jgi:riboflavin kinase/FMN adenylyltransferase
VGENFRFGRGQGGGVSTLRELGERLGFLTEVVPGFRLRGRMVSSSEVRRLIEAGRVGTAGRLLGRCYALEGEVVSGRGVGSRQTVPTLNLATPAEVLPPNGVYVTRVRDLDSPRRWPAVTNVGNRPTFGGGELSVESFLLTGLEGEAPRRIAVEFRRRLRDERKFESPEALKAQILRDVARAQAYFRRLDRWTAPSALGLLHPHRA